MNKNIRAALKRPGNYFTLNKKMQCQIDRELGIRDWEPTEDELSQFKALWDCGITDLGDPSDSLDNLKQKKEKLGKAIKSLISEFDETFEDRVAVVGIEVTTCEHFSGHESSVAVSKVDVKTRLI